jgi:hypothetical protein
MVSYCLQKMSLRGNLGDFIIKEYLLFDSYFLKLVPLYGVPDFGPISEMSIMFSDYL